MSKLKSFADRMFNGEITLFKGLQTPEKFEDANNTFGRARDIAHKNSGEIVIFKGTFPDGKDRAQAVISVPSGQNPSKLRSTLSQVFGVESGQVVGNHFTRDSEGHHYLSLTIDL